MKKIWKACLLCLISLDLWAGDTTDIYRADLIRKELKENAHAVARLDKMEIEIDGPDRAVIRSHEVLTLLDSKAEHELVMQMYSDKSIVLEDAEIRLYDAAGTLKERHKKKDFSSFSAGSGLVEDGQMHYIRVTAGSYPVTVEKITVVRMRSIYVIPSFYFSMPFRSSEYASVSLKYPAALQVKHKVYQLDVKPKHTQSGSEEAWVWEARNIKPAVYETHTGDWRYSVPSIRFIMGKFNYEGYAGDMSSWTNLGLWYNYILGKNNRLSPSHQEDVRKLVANARDDQEKVRMLYTYLQKNFRYVSIQLGIGGHRPFPADFVHEKKYGDCKGLSNYLEACLDALGIKSNVAWINAGDEAMKLDTDFPYPEFNHQILMVPLGKDSIWLECTSNFNDFGHLSSFTENRYALMMTENGGKIVRTPSSNGVQNELMVQTLVDFNQDGNAETKATLKATREFKYEMVGKSMMPADRQKTAFIDEYQLSQPDEFNLVFHDTRDSGYYVNQELFWEKGYEFKAGPKYFLKPRVYKIWTEKLPNDTARKFDYYLEYPCVKTDTTIFQLPEGFSVESLPKGRSIQSGIGKFVSRYWYDEKARKIFSTAMLQINHLSIPAAQYQDARKFFDQVIEDGSQKIIVLNNNGLTKL